VGHFCGLSILVDSNIWTEQTVRIFSTQTTTKLSPCLHLFYLEFPLWTMKVTSLHLSSLTAISLEMKWMSPRSFQLGQGLQATGHVVKSKKKMIWIFSNATDLYLLLSFR
jgi:hypothetical protein